MNPSASWIIQFNDRATEMYKAAVNELQDEELKALRKDTAKVVLGEAETGVVKIFKTGSPRPTFYRISREALAVLKGQTSQGECEQLMRQILRQFANQPITNYYILPFSDFLPEIRIERKPILSQWHGAPAAEELKKYGVNEPFFDCEEGGVGMLFSFPYQPEIQDTVVLKICQFVNPFFSLYKKVRIDALCRTADDLKLALHYEILYLFEKEISSQVRQGNVQVKCPPDLSNELVRRVRDNEFMQAARSRFQGLLGDHIYNVLVNIQQTVVNK